MALSRGATHQERGMGRPKLHKNSAAKQKAYRKRRKYRNSRALRYWLTPPEVYARLNEEFDFDYDPCPYPCPPDHDGLTTEWGRCSYVNPPFCKEDCKGNVGLTEWCRKAVAEQAKGKTSVLVLPAHSYLSVLAQAGAELRDLGRVCWLEVNSKKPAAAAKTTIGFVLRGKRV